MGQKTNPNIFQINKTYQWNSIYIEKKLREHYLYNSRDLEIKKFIIKFFKDKGLIVQNCKLSYLNNSLNVFISFYQQATVFKLIKNINKSQKIKLKKKKKFLKKKRNKPYHIFLRHKFLKKKKLKKKKKRKKNTFNLLYNIAAKEKKNAQKKVFNNYYKYKKLNSSKTLNYYENKIFNSKNKNKFLKSRKKIKRLQKLRLVKKYFRIEKNENIKNELNNKFLNSLFQALNLFYNKKLLLTIVLKHLNIFVKRKLSIKKKKKLKKRLIGLKKYQNNNFFKDGVDLIFSSVKSKNSAELISKYIALTLKKLKRHKFFFRFINSLLKIFMSEREKRSNIVKGIKIKIKGRLNGSRRARHQILSIGSRRSVIKINSNVKYSESTAYTSNGTIGVKVWVFEKKKKNSVCLTGQKKLSIKKLKKEN